MWDIGDKQVSEARHVSQQGFKNEFHQWLDVHLEVFPLEENSKPAQDRLQLWLLFTDRYGDDFIEGLEYEVHETAGQTSTSARPLKLTLLLIVEEVAPEEARELIWVYRRLVSHFLAVTLKLALRIIGDLGKLVFGVALSEGFDCEAA